MTPANDNLPATYEAYQEAGNVEPNKARCINVIANGSQPHVLRNVALYYEQKEEPWADALAGRLRSAARGRTELRRAA